VPFGRAPIIAVDVDGAGEVEQVVADVATATDAALGHGPFLADLVGRIPELRGAPVETYLDVHLDSADESPRGAAPAALLRRPDGTVALVHRFDTELADRIAAQIGGVLRTVRGADLVTDVGLLSEADRALIESWNRTDVDHDRTRTIDQMFFTQAQRTPDQPAITCGGATVDYAELGDQVARMRSVLRGSGVRAGDTVGIALDRSLDMVVSVLAVLAAGANYVPLDPTYPADRLRHMVTDSGARVVVTDRPVDGLIATEGAAVDVTAVDARDRFELDLTDEKTQHAASDLAYVIYTSGSTGLPKGVQLEHRQVVNFFEAMDDVIGQDEVGVWLAVTSLSFDISVLELLWTLTRGYHVVVKQDSGFRSGTVSARRRPVAATKMSLFYFAADEAQAGTGYRLLLEGARWADREGFHAVWTPERHFHSFGAPYPNPSVAAAALAASTERIGIRAGSVVLPLHSPIRVAEEWSVVDNLSGGRVGISFASGWQPNDFVLNPEAYATARHNLPELIDTVQALWRGETRELPGHDGQPVPISTLPRPIQPELPTWLTSAGNPASFERAGRLGMNILTHLIGQTVEQLAENIDGYRAAWAEAGHEGRGEITLMLHTYLHEDGDRARETARLPLKGYLGTAVGLLKDLASAFPTFGGGSKTADEAFRSLSPDEISQLLDHAADRYLETAGLFGTVDDAYETVDAVVQAGVDEIACLIDFGIDDDVVLEGLDLVRELRTRVVTAGDEVSDVDPVVSGAVASETVAELIAAHDVTHLQCTPSLASMLLADPTDRDSLRSLRHMMVGGEALPPTVATELRSLVPHRFTNMYGPTETTIWSLVHELDQTTVDASTTSVPIGRPIANTTMFVLDPWGRHLPVGALGELHLGGEGVARGYLDRPELTSERFVDRPEMGRVYATGDIVRIRPDGIVEFGGRADNQVKIRGHRIELPEIESTLAGHPEVVQSVVVARGDVEPSLVAYVMVRDGATSSSLDQELRTFVRDVLPDAMVPSTVAVIDSFPLTPNGKIDRQRLPDVSAAAGAVEVSDEPPESDSEAIVAAAWTAELGMAVGRNDNFFDVGGHSLLAVAVFRRLSKDVGTALALTDVFRFPTIRTLAAHIEQLGDTASGEAGGASDRAAAGSRRGEMRRKARRGGR
jgi:natural product biosynthesis luciferase-like monooxygenase protein